VDCLDDDSVIAFLDGDVDDALRARLESHLADCAACADLVATEAGGVPETSARRSLGDALAIDASLAPGATVGRYVILNLVGRGGMGEVYAAYDPRLERKVALKLLRESSKRGKPNRAAQERLLREAQSAARLSHPNVVVVYDAGAIDDEVHGVRVYLAMEFIEGQTLAEWLAAQPRPWHAVRDVFAAAGEGLLAAHEAGLVHRDFKPQNVMIGRDGSVRVMDFGLASDRSDVPAGPATFNVEGSGAYLTTQTLAMTRTGVLLGTPLYMAPEQFLARATDARTDQFGFCVALYEALYGERPFATDTLKALTEAVVSGRPREPAQKKGVPAFLRRLVLRGLRADPAGRFRSMQDLLAALRTDPAQRRRIASVGAAVATVAVLALFGAQRVATRGQRMCRGADDKLAGVWELSRGGIRRTAVHGSFLATGSALAEGTWPRVAALLDEYAGNWTTAYTDACEATHVRGDQSDDVLDLRMGCLENARGAFRALTDVLSKADARAVAEAVNAAHALPSLDRCADVAALRAVVPPPIDPKVRAQVAEIEMQLSQVKAFSDTGKWFEARRQAGPLVEAARAIGYEPLLAETLESRSWLEVQLGDFTTARATLEESVWVGLAAHRDDIAAESANQRLSMAASIPETPGQTARWESLAETLLRRLGPGHERVEAWFHQNRAVVSYGRGEFRRAASDLDLALALKRKVLPPNHPDIARSLAAIAYVHAEMGDAESALHPAQEAFDIVRATYGDQSPSLRFAYYDRGTVLLALGRYREAENDLRRSLTLGEALSESDNGPWADDLTYLGEALAGQQKYEEAASLLERAFSIRNRIPLSAVDRAETEFALARAHWALDRNRPATVKMAREAREVYRPLPDCRKRVEEIDAWVISTRAK
jgi:tetratricopeptide (TPR) repeat protein